jgi:hypothetical protein
MAKINLTASAYRVARGKAEIAREEKWLKSAKLTTKKSQELKKRKPAGKDIDRSGGPKNLDQGKATELMGPEAPDNNKKP